RPRHEPEQDRRGNGRVSRRPAPRTGARDTAREWATGRRRPRVRGRSDARARPLRAPRDALDGDAAAGVEPHAADLDRAAAEAEVRRDLRQADTRLAPAGRADVAFLVGEPLEEVEVREGRRTHGRARVRGLP